MRWVADAAPIVVAMLLTLTVCLGGAFLPAQHVPITMALTLALALCLVSGRPRPAAPDERLVVLFLVAGALSAAAHPAAPLAAKEALGSWLIAAAVWSALRTTASRAARFSAAILVVGAVAVAVSVLGSAVFELRLRTGGAFENPNLAAAVMLAGLPLALRWRHRPWSTVAVATASVALVATGSRAGLIGVVGMACGLAAGRRQRWVVGAVGAAIGAIVLALRFTLEPDILAWHRVAIWGAVLRVWWTRPLLGVGPGGLPDAATAFRLLHADHVGQRQFVATFAESTPLAVAVQVGAIGLVLAIFVAVLWRRRGHREGWWSRPLAAAATGFGLFALFHDVLSIAPVLWWWAATLGCLEAGVRSSSTIEGPADRTPSLRWVIGAVFTWTSLWSVSQPELARRRWSEGPRTAEAAHLSMRAEPWYDLPAHHQAQQILRSPEWDWEKAAAGLGWIERALEVHPGRAPLWVDLGRLRLRNVAELGLGAREHEAADEALERALELDPWTPWPWLERARLHRLQGDIGTARRHTLQALEVEPNTARAWLFLARLELDAGRIAEARSALQRARERAARRSSPGLSDVELELLEAPAQQLGELERALK